MKKNTCGFQYFRITELCIAELDRGWLVSWPAYWERKELVDLIGELVSLRITATKSGRPVVRLRAPRGQNRYLIKSRETPDSIKLRDGVYAVPWL